MQAGAIIEATLISNLWETESGITLWSNATLRKKPVATLKASPSGNIELGASDPKEEYGNLVPELVYANTSDFRPYYVRRRVKKTL